MRWALALLWFFPAAASACPACTREGGGLSSYLVWGMMLFPFGAAVAAVSLLKSTRVAADGSLGLVVFLSSWAVMFATLFFAYVFLRDRAGGWPPPGFPRLPQGLPLASTLVLVASSALLALGHWRMAAGLGAIFLLLQAYLWTSLYRAGLTPSAGQLGSILYGLTGLHALHVAVGVVGLSIAAARRVPVRGWATYWHFVGVVWVFIFLSVFVF